jgi:hypothetical protein
VNLQAVDITGLEHRVGGHLRAFCHGGNNVDDMVVGCALQGSQSGNKCVGVADRVSSTRDPIPAEPTTTREVVLPFVVHGLKTRGRISINGFIIPNPHETLAHQFLGVA